MPSIKKTNLRSAVLGLVLAATIIGFGRTNFGTFCIVDGQSMCPTLNPGDVVQARASHPKARGEVVILTDDSGSEAIKRIVGLPGEVITLYGGEVYINGRRLFEPYLDSDTRTLKNNQKHEPAAVWHLAADQYFVLGDNRYWSCDSRHYGPIRRSEIHGTAVLPDNAPEPVFLEITLAGTHHHQTPDPNQTFVARGESQSRHQASSKTVLW